MAPVRIAAALLFLRATAEAFVVPSSMRPLLASNNSGRDSNSSKGSSIDMSFRPPDHLEIPEWGEEDGPQLYVPSEAWETGGLGEGVGRPRVTLKIALDKNGAVDDNASIPGRFTSEESLDEVHRLRMEVQAVVVGISTVLRDDPTLTVRRVDTPEGYQQPIRVVLDRRLRIPIEPESPQVLSDGLRTIVYFTIDQWGSSSARAAELMFGMVGLPVLLQDIPTDTPDNGCPLDKVLEDLWDRGVKHVLVEGGPNVARRFLKDRLVDRAIIIEAPVEFEDPIPSKISSAQLDYAGLKVTEEKAWGEDKVTFYTKEEKK